MRQTAEVGDTVEVNKYCYTKRGGGTAIAKEKITCKIIKRWYDHECGLRYHAVPLDPYLLSWKDAHKPGKEDIIYIGEHDITNIKED